MRFIIELDGILTDLAPGWHRAHTEAAAAVGWSKLDRTTFWRIMRTKGFEGDFLPGAKPIKCKDYLARFDAVRETDEIVAAFAPRLDAVDALRSLSREGQCIGVTLGANLTTRRRSLVRAELDLLLTEVQPLHADPRRRPVELKALAGGDARTVVVGAGDALIRSADAAELFCIGVASGPCTSARLYQAGARTVYPTLAEFIEAARSGAPDLVKAGLPPEPLG